MRYSSLHLGTIVLALTGKTIARTYVVADTYDHTNFFDEFTFQTHPDLNNGHVKYLSKDEAIKQGIVAIQGTEIYLGVDHNSTLQGSSSPGRDSFRLESKATFNRGLLIIRLSHVPEPVCSVWPSVWTLGDDATWPRGGEIDIFEGWNENAINHPAIHVGPASEFGECILDGANQTSRVSQARNCDNSFQDPPRQYLNQGCVSEEVHGFWGAKDGGTHAMEWTGEYLKIYSWPRGSEPANIGDSEPDTMEWGLPSVNLKNTHCDIDGVFRPQRLILTIAFCGNPAGTDVFWNQIRGKSGQTCASKTKEETCVDYVSKHPSDFEESYFKIQDIRYFEEKASGTYSPTTMTSTAIPVTTGYSTKVDTTTSARTNSTTIVIGISGSSSSTISFRSTKAASLATGFATSTLASSTSTADKPSVAGSGTPTTILPNTTRGTPIASSVGATMPYLSITKPASATLGSLVGSSAEVIPSTAVTSLAITSKWTNSDITLSTVAVATGAMYTTRIRTITTCPPHITDCPIGHITTETIPICTSVCLVSTTATSQPLTVGHNSNSHSLASTTSTVYTTKVHTVTACPPKMSNCVVGLIITEFIPWYTAVHAVSPTGLGKVPLPTPSLSSLSSSPSGDSTKGAMTTKINMVSGFCPGGGEGSSLENLSTSASVASRAWGSDSDISVDSKCPDTICPGAKGTSGLAKPTKTRSISVTDSAMLLPTVVPGAPVRAGASRPAFGLSGIVAIIAWRVLLNF